MAFSYEQLKGNVLSE